jgi:hypothetical protein
MVACVVGNVAPKYFFPRRLPAQDSAMYVLSCLFVSMAQNKLGEQILFLFLYFRFLYTHARTRVRVGLKTAQVHVLCPPLAHDSCRHVSSCLCKCFQVDKLTYNLKGTQRFPTVHIRVRIWPGRLIFKK